MKRPTNFRDWANLAAEELRRSAAGRERRLPHWNQTFVTEEENGERTGRWLSIDEFEPVFKEILEKATRGWVNLHVDPIETGVLPLVVEYISRDDQRVAKLSPEKISVNISGPPIAWLETLPMIQKRTS